MKNERQNPIETCGNELGDMWELPKLFIMLRNDARNYTNESAKTPFTWFCTL